MLTHTQVLRFCEAFANKSSANIKLLFSQQGFWKYKKITGSGITLKDNETKDIIKVIRTWENRGILLKETTRKINSEDGRFINFLGPLMRVDLSFMKNVLTPLAKSISVLLGLTAAA